CFPDTSTTLEVQATPEPHADRTPRAAGRQGVTIPCPGRRYRKNLDMASTNAPVLGTAPDISRQEILSRRGDPSLLVVDVLPRESFLDSHLPGAVNLPVAD